MFHVQCDERFFYVIANLGRAVFTVLPDFSDFFKLVLPKTKTNGVSVFRKTST